MKKLFLILLFAVGCQKDPEIISVDRMEIYNFAYDIVMRNFPETRFKTTFPPTRMRLSHVTLVRKGLYDVFIVDSWTDIVRYSDEFSERQYWRAEVRYLGEKYDSMTIVFD